MPTTPLYAHRLAAGIAALSAASADWIDRRTLEEALGVSKWTAWRILKRCGALEGPGGSLVCGREELIEKLQALAQNGRFAPEIARRDCVAQYLDGMVRYASRKNKEVARDQAAVELISIRFSRLPPGIDLQPAELRITFTGTQEFLEKFGAVVFALHNDFEQINEFIEGGGVVRRDLSSPSSISEANAELSPSPAVLRAARRPV